MKSGGDPPPAPDPALSAQAQGQSNIATAAANARLNRVNQTTPWGSITYTQGPVDANGVPSYSSEIKLDPQQQAQLDEQRKQQAYKQQLAAVLLGQAGGSLSKPLDLSGAHKVFDRYASSQPPAPQATPQASGREAMLAQLMEYLQSAGQTPGGGNPAARYAGALRGDSGSPPPSTAAATPGAATPTPAATPASPPHAAPAPGQSPYGASGIDIMNTRAQIRSGGWDTETQGPSPAGSLSRYDNDPRVDGQGAITINGQRYYQVGDAAPSNAMTGRTVDQGRSIYDPEFGYLTPADNYRTPDESWLDRYMPAIVASVFGGAAMAAAGGGAGAAAGGSEAVGTGAFDVGGSAGFGGTVPIEAGGAATGATTGASTIPMGDMGAAAGSGAPVTDLSVAATQPSLGSQALTNWQNGRGLLGMSGGQRAGAAAIPLLAQLLRGNGTRRGG